MNTTTTPESAACGQCANSADNLRTRNAYGEPWKPLQPDLIYDSCSYWMADAFNPVIRDRIVACVNACQGMADPAAEITALRRDLGQARGERDRQKVKIAAMREAIEEAETSLTDIAEYWNQDENESAMSDACWHAVGTAKKALEKLQPFLTQES